MAETSLKSQLKGRARSDFKPRLIDKTRVQALLSGAGELSEVVERYLEWVRYPEYLVFRKENIHSGEFEFKAVKGSKRGNDVYAWRVSKRFEELEGLPNYQFFNYKDRSKKHYTRAVFVTLTMRRFLPKYEAWEKISGYYNLFITKLRRVYGGVSAIRVNESHRDGEPHVHCLLLFEKARFQVFYYNGEWRIQSKDFIASKWSYMGLSLGHVDITALNSTKGGISYVTKYLTKLHDVGIDGSLDDDKEFFEYNDYGSNLAKLITNVSVLTLALMWAYRKRAFSISGDFIDLIREMHNSNLGSEKLFGQVDLEGKNVWVWSLIGFYGGQLPGSDGVPWSRELGVREVQVLRSSPTWSDNLYA